MAGIHDFIRELLWGAGPLLAIQRGLGEDRLWIMEALTLLGYAPGVLLIVAVALWIGGRQYAYYVLGITLSGYLLCAPFWLVFASPRPDDPHLIVYHASLPTPSFPSGHTVTVTILWGTLVAFGWIPVVVALTAIAVVIVSRLYLGVHFLGDSLGGLLLGVLVLLIFPRLWPFLVRWLSHPPFWLSMTAGLLVCLGSVVMMFIFPTHGQEEVAHVAGAALAIPLEHRYIRFIPKPVSLPWQGFKLALGGGGMVLLFAVGRLIGDTAPPVVALGAFLAALWIFLAAPLVFRQLQLGHTATHG